ncbi:MATE family efflux transporter [Saccharophagus sp. K07]|uniref:MATE family efflux transporter n=1 Tax=Saccharophagus sp. K07 TaxID=2283636 RepID=UPI001652A664|nr:MATE family efflux transporter [Saccharophagus sp. K07]MBC6905658.1 MATE family efflux transporter [Saccharophagus sp. K07]
MQAKFTQGSIYRHINVMTWSGTIGLIALYLVDLVDMYFLSLLGQIEINAAIGYAGSILFFTLSLGVGLSIGCGALLAQAVGKGDKALAKRQITHSFLAILAITIPTMVILLLCKGQILDWLGASGAAKDLAIDYLTIILLSMPVMTIAMACSGVLRALGEAKSAMNLSLIAAAVNAVLDPIFIFALGWEIKGAAVATVLARLAMAGYGLWIVFRHHQLVSKVEPNHLNRDMGGYFSIAFPAILTNLSTPIGLMYVTYVMAGFGDAAVAGQAIVGRLQPVVFAGLFALSGVVGPIAAQNLGALQFGRVFETFYKSVFFILLYCAVATALLFLATPYLITAFKIDGLTADIVRWFCYGFSLIFVFNGITFVTNALFNNLRAATYATQFNFGKATLGTIPFAYFGAAWGGPLGVFWGTLIGAAIVAALGLWVCELHIRKLQKKAAI